MFGVRWRWAATRALAIPRVWKGKRIPPRARAHAVRRPAGGGVPGPGGLPGQRAARAHRGPRPPARRGGAARLPHRGHGRARAQGAAGRDRARRGAARWRWTPASPRRWRTRSWAGSPGRTSTTRRSRSGARGWSRSAARCPRTRPGSPGSTRPRSGRSRPTPGPRCGTWTSCTTRCSSSGSCPRRPATRRAGPECSRSSPPPGARRGSPPAGPVFWVAAERVRLALLAPLGAGRCAPLGATARDASSRRWPRWRPSAGRPTRTRPRSGSRAAGCRGSAR